MENLSPAYFEKQNTLMNCVDLEIAASLIYREFMQMFPAERDFWGKLALEEEDHARLYLAGDILKVIGEHEGIKFPPTAFIIKTIEFSQHILDQIQSRSVTLKEALDMALTLEKTIAENIIFDLPESNNPVLANLKKIFADTESHVDRIERFRIEKGFALLD
jgi:hypothetical protein